MGVAGVAMMFLDGLDGTVLDGMIVMLVDVMDKDGNRVVMVEEVALENMAMLLIGIIVVMMMSIGSGNGSMCEQIVSATVSGAARKVSMIEICWHR